MSQHDVLLLSASPPPGGLISGYLAQADAPPGRPAPSGSPDPWAASLAGWLGAAGIPTLAGYPTGRHVVDVCRSNRRFLGLTCGVHPVGPTADVERHLALRRTGWELADTRAERRLRGARVTATTERALLPGCGRNG